MVQRWSLINFISEILILFCENVIVSESRHAETISVDNFFIRFSFNIGKFHFILLNILVVLLNKI